MAANACSGVVMIGTPLEGRGGMSSVVAAYRDGGLFERCGVTYLSPVADGPLVVKLTTAAWVWARFAWLVLTQRVRLVHIHVASGVSFWRKAMFCWIAYLFRRPVILHVHGGNFAEFITQSPAWAQQFIRATMMRAWRIVVLSDSWKNRIGAIVQTENLVVVENPVVQWPVAKRAHGEEIRFLFLGRLERDKGVYELVEAFAGVCKKAPCRLVLGGDGEIESVRARAIELGIDKKLDFLGWVTGDDKQHAFANADVFVLPSHIEALPVSMLEAMNCGLPIVICPVGAIPEVLRDEQEALFVPPGDVDRLAAEMIQLAMDPELRMRLGKAGQKVFAQRFSTDAVLPRLERLYKAALGDSGS